MTAYQWLGALASLLVVGLLIAAAVATWQRRKRLGPSEHGWLSDSMIDQIIRDGRIREEDVPDAGLDFDEIEREEERFWSETWDEPDAYFE